MAHSNISKIRFQRVRRSSFVDIILSNRGSSEKVTALKVTPAADTQLTKEDILFNLFSRITNLNAQVIRLPTSLRMQATASKLIMW